MLSSLIFSAALLSTAVIAAPTPASGPPYIPPPPHKTVLQPLYVNGVDVSKTTFSTPSNLSSPSSPPTPPNSYTHVESNVNVTIVRQDAAAPLFQIPGQDAQLFAAFAKSAYAQQESSLNKQPTDSLPNNKLDIGAKLTHEEAGDHTVHVTVVQDPTTATGPFTYAAGSVVVNALQDWSELWAVGSFAGCAGVLVQDGTNAVAQGSFCGASASS